MILTRIRRVFVRRPARHIPRTPPRRRLRLAVEEFEPRAVPACTTPPTQCFLSQAYRDVLNREIDNTGLAAWTQALNRGFTRQQVVQAVTASQEYRTVVVQAAYSQLLSRSADQAGLNTFTAFLAAGGSFEQMYAAILGSAEYSLRPDNISVGGFLRSLYRDVLGRALDPAGETAYTLLMATGASRGAVALSVLTSVERAGIVVQGYYREFLGRDADSAGFNFFVTSLVFGGRQEQVVAHIVGSAEYFQRL